MSDRTSNERVDLLRLAADDCEAEANNCLREAPNLGPTKEQRNRMDAANIMKRVAALRAWANELESLRVETTPSMDVDTRGRRVQMNEECPDGHHDRGEYFCRRCGRSVVQLASPIQTPAPLNPGQCPNCNHLAKRNEELQKRIHNQRQEIGALLKGGSPESTARKATYRDIYPDDPTWLKEGMTGPWFELPSRLPVEPSAVRDSIAPSRKCLKCRRFFWLDQFDGHDCKPEKVSSDLAHKAGDVCEVCGGVWQSVSNVGGVAHVCPGSPLKARARCEWGCHVHWSGWPASHHPNCTVNGIRDERK